MSKDTQGTMVGGDEAARILFEAYEAYAEDDGDVREWGEVDERERKRWRSVAEAFFDALEGAER